MQAKWSSYCSNTHNYHLLDCFEGTWSAQTNDANQWIEARSESNSYKIIGFNIQGRHSYDQWVTKYKSSYSENGTNFFHCLIQRSSQQTAINIQKYFINLRLQFQKKWLEFIQQLGIAIFQLDFKLKWSEINWVGTVPGDIKEQEQASN
jgi:hypothetical protein